MATITRKSEIIEQKCNQNKDKNPVLLQTELCVFRNNLSRLSAYTKEQKYCQIPLQSLKHLISYQTNFLSCYFGTMSKCRIFASCFYNQEDCYLIKVIDMFLEYIQICCSILDHLDNNSNSDACYYAVRVAENDNGKQDSQELNFIIHDTIVIVLGSIRDLACGNGTIRKRIWSHSTTNEATTTSCSISIFLSLLIRFRKETNNITIYDMEQNESTNNASARIKEINDALWKKEIRLWTNVLGVLRNITHSACNEFCCYFHVNLKGTTELVSILTKWCDSKRINATTEKEDIENQHPYSILHLPPVKVPSREPCFRAMATILNMCEKCITVSNYISTLPNIVQLLVDCCSGNGMNHYNNNVTMKYMKKKHPVLPPGLIHILKCAKENYEKGKQFNNDGGVNKDCLFTEEYRNILQGEETRKLLAQKRELERKREKNSK